MRRRLKFFVVLLAIGTAFLLLGWTGLQETHFGYAAFAAGGNGGGHGNGNGGNNGNGGGKSDSGGNGSQSGNGNGGSNAGGSGGRNGSGNGGGHGNGGGRTSAGGNGNAGANVGGSGTAGDNGNADGTSGDKSGASTSPEVAPGVDGGISRAVTRGVAPVAPINASAALSTVVAGVSVAIDDRPFRAPDEILATGLRPADLLKLKARGFRLAAPAAGAGSTLFELILPKGMAPETARLIVSRINRRAVVDFDDYYYTDGSPDDCTAAQCSAFQTIGWSSVALAACGTKPVIGLVDTGIDLDLPALKGQPIEVISEGAAGNAPSSPAHGTAIASLLVGRVGSTTPGLVPGAKLIAVDAFYAAGNRDRTDAARLIRAIETLTRRGVQVINLSLSGPPNQLLEQAIATAIAKNVVIIAAAGNQGPGAEPAYPAAYPGVVAVTAVDRNLEIYARATHGDYVALAAPGVDLWTASIPDGGSPKSGTSYAVPFVSAAAAVLRSLHPDLAASAITHALYASARDLGDKGHDPVFGWGLVQAGALCAVPADDGSVQAAAKAPTTVAQ